jgi:hypothetical protein
MKRLLLILGLGLLAGAGGYYGIYLARTATVRAVERAPVPALGWLKVEYHLSDAEFAKVSQLHEAYQAHCLEMCRRIDEANAQVQAALAHADQVTPEVEQKLAEAQRLRVECQTAMLRHFFEVSRSMPPEQGRRYLAWVAESTFPSAQGMAQMDGPHY